MRVFTGLIAISLICTGCARPPDRTGDAGPLFTENYSRNLSKKPENQENSAAAAQTVPPSGPWWEHYNDPELNALIAEALAAGPGIAQTRARLEQAAASARTSYADLLPDANVSGSRATERGDSDGPSTFSLRGAAGYELDLWGGNRAAYKSSHLSAQAAAADLRTAQITLSANIVENWLRLLSLREEETLLREQIKTNEMVLDLQHKRYANGAAGALDVLQQTEVLERAKAQLPDVLADQEVTENLLALLAGRNPSVPVDITRAALPETLPIPETGVPADLMRGRPDIGAAWLRVAAADWAAEAARVDRLPNFDISLDYTTSSTKFKNLFNVWMLDLALNLAMPLFDGGEREAEQIRQEALADERFQAYRETVLGAIGEVEDSLALNMHQVNKIEAIERQLQVSRNALEQATLSYGNGDTNYISVLNSLIGVQSLEQQLVRARRDLSLFRVGLYRALGIHPWTGEVNG